MWGPLELHLYGLKCDIPHPQVIFPLLSVFQVALTWSPKFGLGYLLTQAPKLLSTAFCIGKISEVEPELLFPVYSQNGRQLVIMFIAIIFYQIWRSDLAFLSLLFIL